MAVEITALQRQRIDTAANWAAENPVLLDGEIGYVLNPVLVSVSGEPELVGEGCLSVPGLWHDTQRYPHAVVHGIDLDGNPVVLEGEGLMAQALQHETDHLDGTLYLDRLDPARRKQAMREVRESDWF